MNKNKNLNLAIAQVFDAIAQLGNPLGSLLSEIESYLLGRYEACYPDRRLLQKQIVQVVQSAIHQHVLEISHGRVRLSLQHPVPIGSEPLENKPINRQFLRDTDVPDEKERENARELAQVLKDLEKLTSTSMSPNPFCEPELGNSMSSMCDLVKQNKAVYK